MTTLPTDCFGRTTITHLCPECDGGFFGPGECRGVHPKFHNPPVPVERIIGCDPPPTRTWAVVLGPVNVAAHSRGDARKLMAGRLEDVFPAKVLDQHGWRFDVIDVGPHGHQDPVKPTPIPDDPDPRYFTEAHSGLIMVTEFGDGTVVHARVADIDETVVRFEGDPAFYERAAIVGWEVP